MLIDTDELELPTLSELPVVSVTVTELIDKTCCVCADEDANWSDLLGELLVLMPPPPVEDEDIMLELLTLAVDAEVVEP
tara:strand:- start:118 stop:354 length:237 start_codon:yes stop_codon:yes gene_type:complete